MKHCDEIKKVAYELYEKSGCIGGRDLENWLAAERVVMARLAEKEKESAPVLETEPSETRQEKPKKAVPRGRPKAKKAETGETTKKKTVRKKKA